MKECPNCGGHLTTMANADSEDRVNFTWKRCETCLWDERNLSAKAKEPETVMEWLASEGAVESMKFDEDTGRPYRCFTIDLTREG